MLHLVSQHIYHDKFWILLTNDTYISKVHQLNQICDFNICLANWVSNLFFKFMTSYPCFHRTILKFKKIILSALNIFLIDLLSIVFVHRQYRCILIVGERV